jgi:hypothetical protein
MFGSIFDTEVGLFHQALVACYEQISACEDFAQPFFINDPFCMTTRLFAAYNLPALRFGGAMPS